MTGGSALGALNGTCTTRFNMPPFIVTLTTMMFFSGLAIWITTLLTDAADAEGLAQFRVLQRGTPQVEIGTVRFSLTEDSLPFVQSACDIGYRVEVVRTRPNGTKYTKEYWVDSVAHSISGINAGLDAGSGEVRRVRPDRLAIHQSRCQRRRRPKPVPSSRRCRGNSVSFRPTRRA